MKIHLIGSGGREHAMALKLLGGKTPVELWAAPGSDALGQLGTCLPLAVDDVPALAAWARDARPDLVIIGPEVPLVAGLADALRQEIKRITGVEVREAIAEVEPTSGTVVRVFTTGTMVQVFLLARGVPAGNWSGNGSGEPLGKMEVLPC